MSNSYFIQCKLKTLLSNAVKDGEKDYSFELDGFHFRHSIFNFRDGWVDDYWIIEKTIDADRYEEAVIPFYTHLDKLISRIEFVGQAYCGYPSLSPTLVKKVGFRNSLAFFRYASEHKAGGLMFMDREKEALDAVISDKSIPESFYNYWSASTKTKDYSAKMLVLLASIEALVRKEGSLDIALRKRILGDELDEKLFAQKTGLRHRLSHGEHLLGVVDDKQDYSLLVHQQMMKYFNSEIIKKELLNLNVVSPQRTEYGNFVAGNTFITTNDHTPVGDVNSVLENMDGDQFKSDSIYSFDYSEDRKGY